MSVLNETLKDLRNRGQDTSGAAVMGDFGPMVSVPIEEPKQSYGGILAFIVLLFLLFGGVVTWWLLGDTAVSSPQFVAESEQAEPLIEELELVSNSVEVTTSSNVDQPTNAAEATESLDSEAADSPPLSVEETESRVDAMTGNQAGPNVIQTIVLKKSDSDTAHYVVETPEAAPMENSESDVELQQAKSESIDSAAADEKPQAASAAKPVKEVAADHSQQHAEKVAHSHPAEKTVQAVISKAPKVTPKVVKPAKAKPTAAPLKPEAKPADPPTKSAPPKPAQAQESFISESQPPETAAKAAFERGDYSEARENWLLVLAEQAGSQAAYEGLAKADMALGDFDSVDTIATVASANGVDSETLRTDVVRAKIAQQDFQSASTKLDAALLKYPSSTGLLELKANLFQRQGKWAEASASYTQLLANHGKRSEWWLGLGYCYEQLGKPQPAYSAYRRAQLSEPKLNEELARFVASRISAITGGAQ